MKTSIRRSLGALVTTTALAAAMLGTASTASAGSYPHPCNLYSTDFLTLDVGISYVNTNFCTNGWELSFQTDGNLVIYTPSGAPRWATNTFDSTSHLVMQTDGNLVIHAAGGAPVWASNTYAPGAVAHFQTDGNLVIYGPNNGPALWASGN
ncbi:hypothetical protein [Kitasatospora sp. NPDC101183]|uniref:hypothetical protein n=1 Tax=Kitasatospora sp. NPDC101183 TaxID=3364100 RepID=UPI0037F8BF73